MLKQSCSNRSSIGAGRLRKSPQWNSFRSGLVLRLKYAASPWSTSQQVTRPISRCAAFEEHSLLLFREQEITDDVQVAFSRAFGPLGRVKIGSEGAGSFYSRLHNVAAEDGSPVPETHRQALTARASQLWHTDSSFQPSSRNMAVLEGRREKF